MSSLWYLFSKQHQMLLPFLIKVAVQSLDHLCCPFLHLLQLRCVLFEAEMEHP